MALASLARPLLLVPLALFSCSSSDSKGNAGSSGAGSSSIDPVGSSFISCDYGVLLSPEGAKARQTQQHCYQAQAPSVTFVVSMVRAECERANTAPEVAQGFSTTLLCATDRPGCGCATERNGQHWVTFTYASTLGEDFDTATFKEGCDSQGGVTTCVGGVETPSAGASDSADSNTCADFEACCNALSGSDKDTCLGNLNASKVAGDVGCNAYYQFWRRDGKCP